MIQIHSSNDTYQVIESLKANRKKRNAMGEIFVEGIECIKQLETSPFAIKRIFTRAGKGLSDWASEFINRNTQAEVYELSSDLYKGLADKDDPAELLVTADYQRRILADLDCYSLPEKPFILVLDRPSNLGNLGSVIRSADSFGVDAVLINGHGADAFDSKVIRASLGAVFHVPIYQIDSTKQLEEWFLTAKEARKIEIAGSDSGGDANLDASGLQRPLALVIGNEKKGMSVRLRELSDRIISIPLEGRVNSLNAACAASVLMWQVQLNRQL